jgi:hypothetical protein
VFAVIRTVQAALFKTADAFFTFLEGRPSETETAEFKLPSAHDGANSRSIHDSVLMKTRRLSSTTNAQADLAQDFFASAEASYDARYYGGGGS